MKQNDDLMKPIREGLAAGRKLQEAEQTMRTRYAALLKERQETIHAPAAEVECVGNARRLVDATAERWVADHGQRTVNALSGENRWEQEAAGRTGKAGHPRLPDTRPLEFRDLCALAPALMKARLEDIVHTSGAKFGLPAEARAARIAELDRAIADVEEQHIGLVDAAAEVGITLPLLDAVRVRRETEARKLELERQLSEARAAGSPAAGV